MGIDPSHKNTGWGIIKDNGNNSPLKIYVLESKRLTIKAAYKF